MGLDIFFCEDIRNALLAANEASSATAAIAATRHARILDLVAERLRAALPDDTNQVLLDALHAAAVGNTNSLRDYRRGFKAALVTMALAFGVSLAILGQQSSPSKDNTVLLGTKGSIK